MSLPRSSIARLMCAVGIIGLNLAVGRVIYRFTPWRLAGVVLIGVVLQVGLYRLIRSRGRRRDYTFWAGLELGGLVGVTSFLYARVPNSWVGSLWDAYAVFIDDHFRTHFGSSVLNRGPEDPALLVVVAVFAFLPQLLMALVGGSLGLSLGSSPRSRHSVYTLFAIVGILVFDAAAFSTLPAQPPWLYAGVAPGGLLLQLGLYGAIRSWGRPRPRAFWVGFAAVASIVFWSYLSAMTLTPTPVAWNLAFWPDGPSYARPITAAPLWALWINYTSLASYALGRPAYGTFLVVWNHNSTDSLVYSLIVLLPHLLAALVGGILALLITRLADTCLIVIRAHGTKELSSRSF